MSSVIQSIKDTFKGNDSSQPLRHGSEMESFYKMSAQSIDGKTTHFNQFEKKVVLVTNVAAKNGSAEQNFQELTRLYDKFERRGFVVLAFPTGQFDREVNLESQIKECVKRFNIRFPVFSKIDVNGSQTHPVYQFLKSYFPGDIEGNFSSKFLVNRKGAPVGRFEKEPFEQLENMIDQLLDENESDTSADTTASSSLRSKHPGQNPAKPTRPTNPESPTHPPGPSDTSDPSDSTKPSEPTQTIDPSRPIDPFRPLDRSNPLDSSRPPKPSKPFNAEEPDIPYRSVHNGSSDSTRRKSPKGTSTQSHRTTFEPKDPADPSNPLNRMEPPASHSSMEQPDRPEPSAGPAADLPSRPPGEGFV